MSDLARYSLAQEATAAAEQSSGSGIVTMGQRPAYQVLPQSEGVRFFTNGLEGCVGIGYTAVLSRRRRAAYLEHANYGDVLDGKTIFSPLSAGRVKNALGVITALTFVKMAPFTAADDFPHGDFRSYGASCN